MSILEGGGPVRSGAHPHHHVSNANGSVRIQPQGALVLDMLMFHAFVSRSMLIEALWPDPDTQPLATRTHTGTVIARLRRALHGTNVVIRCQWGRGHYLEIIK